MYMASQLCGSFTKVISLHISIVVETCVGFTFSEHVMLLNDMYYC
jgi:hypothetical protein